MVTIVAQEKPVVIGVQVNSHTVTYLITGWNGSLHSEKAKCSLTVLTWSIREIDGTLEPCMAPTKAFDDANTTTDYVHIV